jgi:hypothetical protein
MSSGQHKIAAGTKYCQFRPMQQKKNIFYKNKEKKKKEKKPSLTFTRQRWISNGESAVKIFIGILICCTFNMELH